MIIFFLFFGTSETNKHPNLKNPHSFLKPSCSGSGSENPYANLRDTICNIIINAEYYSKLLKRMHK